MALAMVKWLFIAICAGIVVYYGTKLLTRLLYGDAIFADTSAEALRQAEEKLKKNGVPYSVNTVKKQPQYLAGKNAQVYGRLGLSDSDLRAQYGGLLFICKARVSQPCKDYFGTGRLITWNNRLQATTIPL